MTSERYPHTRSLDETVRDRFLRDESFREALIAEAFNEIESGEKAVGLAILNDCVLPAYRGVGRGCEWRRGAERKNVRPKSTHAA